jgi:hypothetical protein
MHLIKQRYWYCIKQRDRVNIETPSWRLAFLYRNASSKHRWNVGRANQFRFVNCSRICFQYTITFRDMWKIVQNVQKETQPWIMYTGTATGQHSKYSRRHIVWDIRKCSITWFVVWTHVQTIMANLLKNCNSPINMHSPWVVSFWTPCRIQPVSLNERMRGPFIVACYTW